MQRPAGRPAGPDQSEQEISAVPDVHGKPEGVIRTAMRLRKEEAQTMPALRGSGGITRSTAIIEGVAVGVPVCECSKVHMYEVEFKLDGMIVVPTHKNCGFALNEKQADIFQKELVKSWGLSEDG